MKAENNENQKGHASDAGMLIVSVRVVNVSLYDTVQNSAGEQSEAKQ